MLRLLILGILLSTIHTYPVNDEELIVDDETKKAKEIEELKEILNDLSYVNNFKNMMADYVKSQYNDLTVHEMEKIEDYLEDFCHKFAKDLKNILDNVDNFTDIEKFDDGLPDSTFADVKDCIKNELPNIKDETAERVTYALRKNIFITRQKIDEVIRNSQFAAVQNS
ncbi:unnamed protein product [Euphydryas editha]|uniref:Uncharacterized protein n=1 Tax=Euphydryas editha TaxID=104508 RepID=A0AAU9TCJ5_EUPED|nr:unnamed protein product [Euphydryas editha]